jgi:hypothetical protein
LLVFCAVSTNLSTMAAAGAIRRGHSLDGGIQWLQMKPQMPSIGRCALRRITPEAWPSKLPAICLYFS